MRWIDQLERRAPWLAFPGLFRFYTLLGVLAFALSWMRPDLAQLLDFDRSKILSGQVWRAFTFLFAPNAFPNFSLLAVFFLYCAVMVGFLINDSLETEWGVFRTSIFHYAGFLFLLAGNFLLPAPAWNGGLFYTSAFFAFATLFPRHEFLLFFILPVQVRFLAWFAAAGLAITAFGQPILLPFLLFAFLNYLLWIGPGFLKNRKALGTAAVRRRRFEKSRAPAEPSFHRCHQCQRTEHDDPSLEFRVGPDGEEYCADHLPANPKADS